MCSWSKTMNSAPALAAVRASPVECEVDREHPEATVSPPAEPAERGRSASRRLPPTGVDGPDVLDLAVAHRVQAVGEVHACARVDRDEREALADLSGPSKLRTSPCSSVMRSTTTSRSTASPSDRRTRQAGAADDARSPANVFEPQSIVAVSGRSCADHGGEDRQRAGRRASRAEADLHQVVEHVRPGPHLGDAGHRIDSGGR